MTTWTQRTTPTTTWVLEGNPVVNATNGIIGFDLAETGNHLTVSSTGAITGVSTTKGSNAALASATDLGWVGGKL
jgi:hypothetical protein